jgi:hypothetical protein
MGPVKSAASSAILTLPPFAIQALRTHRRSQARLRLAYAHSDTVGGCAGSSPAVHPDRSSSTWCSIPSGAHRSTPYAMPTAARSPSGSTSTSSPRPHPGWPN